MKRFAVLLALLVLAGPAAAEPVTFPAPEPPAPLASRTLKIYGGIDRGPIEIIIRAFQKQRPSLAVSYWEFNTNDLYQRYVEEADQGANTADIVISSAMDLQIKLVNDGYAQEYFSLEARSLPDWAVWRNSAFGFTFEPAVIAYNKTLMPPEDVPHTRFDLVRLLESRPQFYDGKVATYDPERSGLGLMFMTQDAKQSQVIWSLARAFGATRVKLYSNTDPILDQVAAGKLLIGYNLLGSYASTRSDPNLAVVLPTDYTLVLSRIAFIARDAPHQADAQTFIDFLLSAEGQRNVGAAGLYSIRSDVTGRLTAARLSAELGEALRPIKVGPALMVNLDPIKRRIFLERWQRTLAGQ